MKFKVTRKFTHNGVAVISALTLEAAQEQGAKLPPADFQVTEGSEESYIYSIVQEQDKEEIKPVTLQQLLTD
tara:strand:+ start:142 stop:357 length:216 start_codon:yes stop_codon:yes gene_type:complete